MQAAAVKSNMHKVADKQKLEAILLCASAGGSVGCGRLCVVRAVAPIPVSKSQQHRPGQAQDKCDGASGYGMLALQAGLGCWLTGADAAPVNSATGTGSVSWIEWMNRTSYLVAAVRLCSH